MWLLSTPSALDFFTLPPHPPDCTRRLHTTMHMSCIGVAQIQHTAHVKVAHDVMHCGGVERCSPLESTEPRLVYIFPLFTRAVGIYSLTVSMYRQLAFCRTAEHCTKYANNYGDAHTKTCRFLMPPYPPLLFHAPLSTPVCTHCLHTPMHMAYISDAQVLHTTLHAMHLFGAWRARG